MSKLQDLLAKKAELDREIEETRRRERAEAISQVQSLMAEHGLTLADVSGRTKSASAGSAKKTTSKVAPRYRDDQGNTWAGRGLQPRWLRDALASGKTLQDFAI